MKTDELAVTARLANLNLSPQELEALGDAVSQMLDYFSVMNSFDVKGLVPTTHAFHRNNVLREDTIQEFSNTDDLVESAPESEDRFFLIPNVL